MAFEKVEYKFPDPDDAAKQNIEIERMEPDLLNAFRKNPYTQSLNSTALR
mgnify:CR=1 FL=1